MPKPVSVIDGPGLFGKTPDTGDFVSRNLPQAYRRALDGWVTTHLGARRDGWPVGGVRGLLELGGGQALMLALPSSDKVGRQFPLVALTNGAGLSLEDAESWCNAACDFLVIAAAGEASIDETIHRLTQIEPALREGPIGDAALWTAGQEPMVCDAETVEALFSSG
jgi:hypothetical protein